MRRRSLGLGGVCGGLVLAAWSWAGVATAGSFITYQNSPVPRILELTRDGQAWMGDRTDPGTGTYEVGVWNHGAFEAFTDGFGGGPISDDGRQVVGSIVTVDWSTWPPLFTWTGYLWNNGVLIPLASAGEDVVYPTVISGNGQVLVGTLTLTGQPARQAFRMEGGVKTLLGMLPKDDSSFGQFVTGDGGVVAAESYNSLTGNKRVFLWSNGVTTELPDLPGADPYSGADDDATILALSDDGTTVAGLGSGPQGWRFVRWVNGQLEVLWHTRVDWAGIRSGISTDGTIISAELNGVSTIWRDGLGIKSFERYASYHHDLDLGLNPGDFLEVTSMTPDGRLFGGAVYDSNWNAQATFLVYLDPADYFVPEPSSLGLALMAAAGLVWSARRNRGSRR